MKFKTQLRCLLEGNARPIFLTLLFKALRIVFCCSSAEEQNRRIKMNFSFPFRLLLLLSFYFVDFLFYFLRENWNNFLELLFSFIPHSKLFNSFFWSRFLIESFSQSADERKSANVPIILKFWICCRREKIRKTLDKNTFSAMLTQNPFQNCTRSIEEKFRFSLFLFFCFVIIFPPFLLFHSNKIKVWKISKKVPSHFEIV